MKVEVDKLILNEVEVIEEMLNTGIIPQFYNTKNVLNRLYRYFEGNIDKVLPALEMLGIRVDKQYVEENIEFYTEVQPLTQGKEIKIYKSELDKIKKLKSRQTQRTAFGLLMFKKIVNEKCNRQDNVLRLDSIKEIFKYVTKVDNTEKSHNDAWHHLQQDGIIDVDWDCNIELKILQLKGEVIQTIAHTFHDCDYWFDKLVPADKLETIVAVLPDGTVTIYKEKGYRGTANKFEEDFNIKVDSSDLRKCCNLKKKHCKKVIFFVLDVQRYELEKEQYLESVIKERQDLLKKKK